jgi:hypothetical protein
VSKFDFSFDCVSPEKGRETHSLGVGTFDEEEEYDTDLKCQECVPSHSSLLQRKAAHKKLAKKHRSAPRGVSLAAIASNVKTKAAKRHKGAAKSKAASKAVAQGAAKSKAASKAVSSTVWYGPDNCVGTYRDTMTGKCVMVTNCAADTQLDVYEFGLICADKDNELTRHLFGMGTFGHKETFNTDVACDQCLALDEYMDSDKAISKLTETVQSLKADLAAVDSRVEKMSARVSPETNMANWATVATTEPNTAAGAQSGFLVKQAAVSQKPAPQEQSPKATPQTSNLGKDVSGVSDNGHEVQHVKQKASHAKKADASAQALLAAAVNKAEKNGGVPKKVAQSLTQASSQAPEAQQQEQQQQTVEVQVSDEDEQQNQDSQEKDDSKDQKGDQNSQQEEAQNGKDQNDEGQESDSESDN